MKGNLSYRLIIIAFATLAEGHIFSHNMEPVFDRFVSRLINCDFDSAFQTADSFSTADSADPTGPLLGLFVYGMRDLDLDRRIDTAGFLRTYRTAVQRIAGYERRHGRSSYSMTMAGFANATHAAYYLHQKRYFAAIGTGLDALRMLYDAKAADSANYDVDFFLGLYDYTKAELRARLWMVLFWYDGDKQEGIRRLRDCSNRAQIASTAARMSLAEVYIKENMLDSARLIIDDLLREYPSSRFILWTQAKYLEAAGERKAAADVYGVLSNSYAATKYGSLNSIATRQLQIQMLCGEKQFDEARQIAKKTLAGICREPQWRRCEPCNKIRELTERGGCGGDR